VLHAARSGQKVGAASGRRYWETVDKRLRILLQTPESMPPAVHMNAGGHHGCLPSLELLDESLKLLHEFDNGAVEGPWKINASAAALR
jgi:hypothetical protein